MNKNIRNVEVVREKSNLEECKEDIDFNASIGEYPNCRSFHCSSAIRKE